MKHLLISIAIVTVATTASAMTWTGEFGIRNNTADGLTSGTSAKTVMGLTAGATTEIQMADSFYLKTGAVFTQRDVKAETTGGATTVDGKFSYIDVPVLATYKFNDMWAAYGGIQAALKMSSSCSVTNVSTCDLESQSLITPLVVGASATFEKTWQVGLYYETSTKMGNIKNSTSDFKGTALGLNAGYTF